jgi:hypothetical protein
MFNAVQIISGAVIGGIVGAVAITVKQVAGISFKPDTKLDPPCPIMEDSDTTMADTFREFLGPYHRMCPEESKVQYKVG